MSEYHNLTVPPYMVCTDKDSSLAANQTRYWIYSRLTLSLCEIINVDHFKDFNFKGIQDRFEYKGVNYFAVVIQNNCPAVDQDINTELQAMIHYFKSQI